MSIRILSRDLPWSEGLKVHKYVMIFYIYHSNRLTSTGSSSNLVRFSRLGPRPLARNLEIHRLRPRLHEPQPRGEVKDAHTAQRSPLAHRQASFSLVFSSNRLLFCSVSAPNSRRDRVRNAHRGPLEASSR